MRPAIPLLSCSLLIPLGAACGGPQSPLAATPGAPVVLISIDTLRADHLGCYGYGRDTSPVIDAFAQESLRFERVYAQSNNTGPSHMTMLTGVLPDVHGITHGGAVQTGDEHEAVSLAPGVPYLAKLLDDFGYETACFADGGYVIESLGFDRGFDHFESGYERFSKKLERVEPWIAAAPVERSFLFVHTYGVHDPYVPSVEHDVFSDPAYDGPLAKRVAALRAMFNEESRGGEPVALGALHRAFWPEREDLAEADQQHLVDLYDGCIRDVDAGVGRLLGALGEAGWLDEAWIVITSDHGEAFNEHGTYTHRQLYEEELRVPLLVRPPGGLSEPRVEAEMARLIDLTPTVLAALGIASPRTMQGVSLLETGVQRIDESLAVAGENIELRAHVSGGHKLIFNESGPWKLYDLQADPGELRNLLEGGATEPLADGLYDRAGDLRAAALALQEVLGDPEASIYTDEQLEEMRGLGYLGTDED